MKKTIGFFLIVHMGCNTKQNSQTVAQVQPEQKTMSSNSLLSKLNIPKSWVEITLIDSQWTYFIPCIKDSDLKTIELKIEDNEEEVMWNWGSAGQWFALKKVTQQGDSIIFETVVPYDTTAAVQFSVRYLDEGKSIAGWYADGNYCNYIPIQDTGKYKRIQQPCDED